MANGTCVTVNMGPACVDIKGIRANDRNEMQITIKQKGQAINITDVTLEAQARLKSTDPDPPALEAVITPTDAPNGIATMRWPGDAVANLLAGKASWKGVWDLQFGTAGNDPVTIASGAFQAEMDVTR